MGLAASQARFLSLTARKTNVEYEGQQINQQRTALANQSAGLFNQMLALEVPTPPVATDYQKTYYTFLDPTNNSTMTIDYIMPPYQNDAGQTRYSVQTTRKYADTLTTYIDLNNVEILAPQASDDNQDYIINSDLGRAVITGPHTAKGLSNDSYFGQALKDANAHINGTNLTDNDKYFTFTINNVEYYIPAGDVESVNEYMELLSVRETNDPIEAFSAQGISKSETKTYDDVILNQANDGTGRYESMTYYETDSNGTIRTITLALTQQTVQDEDAYNAAMETYEAKKDIYDKAVADIDVKTTIIQQQDKNLELHLNQLDTEQQAIQTEMDAIKKVIDKNIEETFKTFA